MGRRWERGRNEDPDTVGRGVGAEEIDYIVIISGEILGAEWSMSKVGIPPPNDSEKSHALVAGKPTKTTKRI